jgi:hypothetical protein
VLVNNKSAADDSDSVDVTDDSPGDDTVDAEHELPDGGGFSNNSLEQEHLDEM